MGREREKEKEKKSVCMRVCCALRRKTARESGTLYVFKSLGFTAF